MSNNPRAYWDWLPVETLGQRVRKLREERSLSMREMVKRSPEVSISTISRVENGRDILVSDLHHIAQALDVPLHKLVEGVHFEGLGKFERPNHV